MKRKVVSLLLCAVLLFTGVLPAFAASPARYVVLGDSIAYGSGLSNPREAVYGKIVADTNGYNYENFAVPGHTTAALLRRMENEEVKAAIRRADIISISIGGNNFLLSDLNGLLYDGIVKEDYTRIGEIAEGFYTDLGKIIGNIRKVNSRAAILLQTLYNPQTGYIGKVYQVGADRLNEKVNAYAKAHPGQILIVDVGGALTDSAKDFAEDRIHPSAAGNEKIAREVLKTLYENGLGAKTTPVIKTRGKDAKGAGTFSVFVKLYGNFFHMLAMLRKMFALPFGG